MLLGIFFRRLGALLYDTFLLLSLFMIGSLLILFFTHGAAIPPQNFYYQTFLFGLAFVFFVGFWRFGGQTAGMRAWQIQVVTRNEGNSPSIVRGAFRFFLALITQCCGGLGWFWIFFDPDRQTLYDRLSGTELVFKKQQKRDVQIKKVTS